MPSASARPARPSRPATASLDGPPSPVSVVVGEEELLVERAVAALVAAAAPAEAVQQVRGADLRPGELATLTAPSLFGGGGVLVVHGAESAARGVADELTALAADPPPDQVTVLTHAGGAKGKALLTALTAAGRARRGDVPAVRIVECPKITRVGERMQFIRGEAAAARRKIDESGVRALIDTIGNDLRELAAACAQLASDTTGVIDQAAVHRYYRGRAEASGFTVADRAVEGKLGEALELLRWALAVGVAPVLISSGLAQGVRLLGRVGSAPKGQPDAVVAAEVGAPPWKVDRVRQQLRGWTPDGVARALAAVAQADAQVKGEGASPGYALEAAIREIVASRAAR
jgi:DNA polymerase III subunit delta